MPNRPKFPPTPEHGPLFLEQTGSEARSDEMGPDSLAADSHPGVAAKTSDSLTSFETVFLEADGKRALNKNNTEAELVVKSSHGRVLEFLTNPSKKTLGKAIRIGLIDLKEEELTDAISRAEKLPKGDDSQKFIVAALSLLGNRYYKERNFAKARSAFERALEIDPKSLYALSDMGKLELESGNYPAAESYFNRVSAIEPENYFALRGLARLGKNNIPSAIALTERMLITKPGDATALKLLSNLETSEGLNQIMSGQQSLGEAHLQKALEANPKNSWTLRCLGRARVRQGRTQDARELFERALKIHPRNVKTLCIASNLEKKAGNFTQAEGYLIQALEVDPRNVVTLNSMAELKNQRGFPQEAMGYLETALTIDPENSITLTAIANMQIGLGIPGEAVKLLERALTASPEDPIIMTSMGHAQLIEGNFTDAEKYLSQALKTEPENAGIECLMADALRLNGKANAADRIIGRLVDKLAQLPNDLQFSVLCIFYLLHPDDASWPGLESSTNIKKSEVARVAETHQKQIVPFSRGLKGNRLWQRNYSSGPINRQAVHGMSDFDEYDWGDVPPSTKIRPGKKED